MLETTPQEIDLTEALDRAKQAFGADDTEGLVAAVAPILDQWRASLLAREELVSRVQYARDNSSSTMVQMLRKQLYQADAKLDWVQSIGLEALTLQPTPHALHHAKSAWNSSAARCSCSKPPAPSGSSHRATPGCAARCPGGA